mmetsp:Transcript_6005/g.15284  ORF Transcript_6005/g.15284 Transcript_6005/m.15284 type:complete len:345 (-) Transcript_6005:403-1437(-)
MNPLIGCDCPHPTTTKVAQRLQTGDLLLVKRLPVTHTEQVQNAVEAQGTDANLGLLLDLGLSVEGHPEPRELEHRDIVGAVSHSNHLLQAEALLLGDGLQELCLAIAVDDFAAHLPSKLPLAVERKLVGMNIIHTEDLLELLGEVGEAARQDPDLVPQPLEVADEARGAFSDGEGSSDLSKLFLLEALEQTHAFPERLLEVELAPHRRLGDLSHLSANTRPLGKFVNNLALDEGRVHVEENQPPVAPEEIVLLHGDVDGVLKRDLEELFPQLVNGARLAAHLKLQRAPRLLGRVHVPEGHPAREAGDAVDVEVVLENDLGHDGQVLGVEASAQKRDGEARLGLF